MSKIRILVVDDERMFTQVVVKYLLRYGYEVDGVSSAQECIQAIKEKEYNILVCDVCLPKLSGVALMKMVRQRFPLMKIIMMTGYTHQEMAKECLSLGAYDFLYKPFRLSHLLVIVREIHARLDRWAQSQFITTT